jgi:hypothetical protein
MSDERAIGVGNVGVWSQSDILTDESDIWRSRLVFCTGILALALVSKKYVASILFVYDRIRWEDEDDTNTIRVVHLLTSGRLQACCAF